MTTRAHHEQAVVEIATVIETGALSAHEILDQLTGALDPWTLTTSWKFVKMTNKLLSPGEKGENKTRTKRE